MTVDDDRDDDEAESRRLEALRCRHLHDQLAASVATHKRRLDALNGRLAELLGRGAAGEVSGALIAAHEALSRDFDSLDAPEATFQARLDEIGNRLARLGPLDDDAGPRGGEDFDG